MNAPSDEELLRVWESHQRSHPTHRALAALAIARPERGWDGWARAPIGERDSALLALYEQLFGHDLHTTTACPRCGERLESEFTTGDIRSEGTAAPHSRSFRERDFSIEYRSPTSEDLLQVIAERGRSSSGDASDDALLLRRCVRVQQGGAAVDPATLPVEIVDRISSEMQLHDPDADVRIALECPACGYTWELHFDIVSHFWGELDDWAQRTLADVHALALAYGWTEPDVLCLTPARRRMYVDMVSA